MKIHHLNAPRPYATNSFVLSADNGDCIIIDPAADLKLYHEFLGGEVTLLLTHGHFDHVYTVDQLREKGAKLYMSKQDAELFSLTPDGFLAEGDIVSVGDVELTVLETPGHSPGSLCFYHKNGHLFAGDTLFYGSCGRCDLEGGDFNTIKLSLKRLATLPPDTVVYPGHERLTTIGEEILHNPYM